MLGSLFMFVGTLVCLSVGQDTFPHTTSLRADYKLSWRSNTSHIEFKAVVGDVDGYFGLGISANGSMFPADVVVGYFDWDQGKPVLNDYHTTEHAPPVMDKSQDWVLQRGVHANNRLTFEFVRALDTGDRDGDRVIPRGMSHVIWAMGGAPTSPTDLRYHGYYRGSVDLALVQKADVIG